MRAFSLTHRMWLVHATVYCDICDVTHVLRMTDSMLADKLVHGHVCQGCVNMTLIALRKE